ncbi:MAG: glutaminyl-tRNA synthase (glutamine-hydrolyzing) subunit B [Chloroflexi bacterium RBG_16_64_43]|nr:MAG: glutaminyl-tRNA synthase (glutamine-hydrolyzing) subunit B [Chloroflexi bacterium RBG_16_64_43]
MAEWEAVIGLETHIQLSTESKIFCRCRADSWGQPPNTNICPVCCGLPGVLPVLNRGVVEKAVRLAAAVHATIAETSYFARKNYFYPDLPKGYQISQYDEPLARGGYFDLPLPGGATRRLTIQKLHLEEDAGKTKLAGGQRYVDMNRCGVPLVEMVTGPDLRSADEAAQYLIRLRQLLRWLETSEANMERAQLRCDANVSIRPAGAIHLNPKTEIKNVNSIEAVRDAIAKEIQRQVREVESGGQVEAWTLEWDEDAGMLRKMRAKETEGDYRYFREPDLLPIRLDEAWRTRLLATMPELPLERRARFVREYQLPEYDAEILTEERSLSEYFEAAARAYSGEAKRVSNWMMNDVLRLVREHPQQAGQPQTAALAGLTPAHLAEILTLVDSATVTLATGKALLEKVIATGTPPRAIVEREGLAQISGAGALEDICRQAIAENPEQATQYRAGKTTLLQWFVGQVMKKSRGKANPQETAHILEKLLVG